MGPWGVSDTHLAAHLQLFGISPSLISYPNLLSASSLRGLGTRLSSLLDVVAQSLTLTVKLEFSCLFQVKRIVIGHLMWNSKRGELSLLWNDWRQTESTLSYWRICSFVKCQFIGCLKIASQRKSICKIDSKKAFCCVLLESFFQFCRSIFNKLVSFQSSSESPDYFNNFVFFFLVVALNNALINS